MMIVKTKMAIHTFIIFMDHIGKKTGLRKRILDNVLHRRNEMAESFDASIARKTKVVIEFEGVFEK